MILRTILSLSIYIYIYMYTVPCKWLGWKWLAVNSWCRCDRYLTVPTLKHNKKALCVLCFPIQSASLITQTKQNQIGECSMVFCPMLGYCDLGNVKTNQVKVCHRWWPPRIQFERCCVESYAIRILESPRTMPSWLPIQLMVLQSHAQKPNAWAICTTFVWRGQGSLLHKGQRIFHLGYLRFPMHGMILPPHISERILRASTLRIPTHMFCNYFIINYHRPAGNPCAHHVSSFPRPRLRILRRRSRSIYRASRPAVLPRTVGFKDGHPNAGSE